MLGARNDRNEVELITALARSLAPKRAHTAASIGAMKLRLAMRLVLLSALAICSDGFTVSPWLPRRPRTLIHTHGASMMCTYEAIRPTRPPPPTMDELKTVVKPAGDMGMGCFAAEDGAADTWVCQYVGEPITLLESTHKYADKDPQYLFQITPDLYLDAEESTHHSRFFNHAQFANLKFTVDVQRQRVDFWLQRDVRAGDQLMFDYGMAYWLGLGITPVGDTRNFTRPTPHSRSRQPTGPKPITPTSPVQLAEVLALAEGQARPALLRALEYFGAMRLGEGVLRIRFGLGEGTPTRDVDPEKVELGVLHEAAAACIAQASRARP